MYPNGRLSTKGPPHLAPVHRVEWESRGREVFPTVDGGDGVHLGSAEAPEQ